MYEFWNVESGNLLGTFPDEAAALDAVAEAIQRNGAAYGAMLALGRESSRGGSKMIASGSQLAERVALRGQTGSVARRRHSPGS